MPWQRPRTHPVVSATAAVVPVGVPSMPITYRIPAYPFLASFPSHRSPHALPIPARFLAFWRKEAGRWGGDGEMRDEIKLVSRRERRAHSDACLGISPQDRRGYCPPCRGVGLGAGKAPRL